MNFARPILRAMLGVIRLGLVRLKDAAGVLEIRNDDDSDYADLQAKKGIFSELQAAFDPPPAVGQALIAADVDGNLIFGNVAAGGSGANGFTADRILTNAYGEVLVSLAGNVLTSGG